MYSLVNAASVLVFNAGNFDKVSPVRLQDSQVSMLLLLYAMFACLTALQWPFA